MSLTEEETNFLRLTILVIKLSPKAVRVLFDNKFPPTDLTNILKRKLSKLKSLNDKKIINLAQWDLLYPANKGSGTFDLTLLICLLRNIATPAIRKPGTGFDQLPNNHDITEGADLARIKYYRNLIAHNTDGTFNYTEFNTAWNGLSQAISRLGFGRYDQDSNDLRIACLDGSDREVYREVLNTNQKLEQLRVELKEEREKTVPWTEQDRIDKRIQRWEEKDKKFIETASYDAIWTGIEQNQCVLVTGNSGAGKSAVIHHVALKLRNIGYKILPIIQPGDIFRYHNPNISQVFVCDDACGKYYADTAIIEEWIRFEEDLKLLFDNTDMKLLINTRLIVSQDECFKMMLFLDPCIVNLNSPHHRLSLPERKAILNRHLLNEDDDVENDEADEIQISQESLESQNCFPLLCELFGENKSLRNNPEAFFSKPFEEYSKNLERLKMNKRSLKYCALAILVVFNDNLTVKMLSDLEIDKEDEEKIDAICGKVGQPKGTSRQSIMEELESLENIYVRKVNGKFRSLHDKMFDFLSSKIGPTVGLCLLKYSPCTFIRERVRLYGGQKDDDENIILLDSAYEDDYFKRMFADIMDGNIKDVFFNKQMQDRSFEDALLKQFKRMNDDDLEKMMKKSGDYSKTCGNSFQRSNSTIVSFPNLTNSSEDMDEIAKFHLSYMNSLLYQEETSTFHWLMAQGLDRAFSYVLERFPKYVKEKIMQNYNLCVSLAALQGRTEILSELLMKYPREAFEKDANDKRYYPIFIFVCFTGNLKLVKFLHMRDLIYPEKTESGESALWVAAYSGQIDVLEFLIKYLKEFPFLKEFRINSVNKQYVTPLFIASQRGHVEIVKLLLQNGADVNKCKKNGASPLFVACHEGHLEIVKLLHKSKADVNLCKHQKLLGEADQIGLEIKGCISPLFIACKIGNSKIVQFLLDHDADTEISTEIGKTPLFIALQNSHEEIARLLIEGKCNVNQSMANGYIPLTVVAGKGQVKIIQMLIENGASVNISNHETISSKSICEKNIPCNNNIPPSPLSMASLNNHFDVVKVLIQNGADIDYRGVEGATALFEASERGNIEVVKYLLSMKASVNIPTYRGRTPLFVAVQRRLHQIATILLENNADVNLCREDGVSPLLRATIHGDAKLIKLLLKNKADPNLATSEGLYPIMYAARQGHTEILLLIIKSGAQMEAKNSKHQTPLWIAAFYGQKDCMQCLLDYHADIFSTDQDEESVLLASSRHADVSLIQCLIDAGSNVNLCNKKGISPLFRAVELGNLNVAKYLISAGANVNLQTTDNDSALIIAGRMSNLEMVELLLHNKADVDATNRKGHSCLWEAVLNGNKHIVSLLLDNGANCEITIEGKTSIVLAEELNYYDIADLLIEKRGRLKQWLRTFGWLMSLYSKVNSTV
ncbi:uncharacterized protein LOC143052139 [Mytilus galloprovincialis]|uniref:uncharacterized protein LOC143052139 n=1 Tax=Mytilus galloprovincialis TaxID=29158 RepID=UPI003F7B9BDB